MNPVEPIRDTSKLANIKRNLRKQPRNYCLFTLGINTALRVGDLLALKVKDVTEGGKVKEFITLREQKTGKDKRVKLNRSATEAIEFYLSKVNLKPGDFLFPGRTSTQAITRYQARQAGIPLELIQAKLGHASPAVTRRYIGITADEIEHVENHVNL